MARAKKVVKEEEVAAPVEAVEETAVEPVEAAEEAITAPIEAVDPHQCPSCHGSGRQNADDLCHLCLGSGRVL